MDKKKVIFIQSKSDLFQSSLDNIKISTKTNEGILSLLEVLSTKLSSIFGLHSDHDPIIVSKRQRYLLLEAQRISSKTLALTNNNVETDILASMLRGLNDLLSEIIGNVSNTDVVNNIFSEFCVGK